MASPLQLSAANRLVLQTLTRLDRTRLLLFSMRRFALACGTLLLSPRVLAVRLDPSALFPDALFFGQHELA